MMLIVEPLEVLALPLKRRIAWEPLPPKELPVIGVVEMFNNSVSPRLPNWDEDRGNTVEET
jgi:hypothetical protein